MFTSPIRGEMSAPFCATRDIAAVASRLLLDDTWSGSGQVPVLGPEDLSWHDMATIMSRVLDRPIRFQQMPGDQFTGRLTGSGMSEAMAQAMLDMAMAKDAGLDNAVTRTRTTARPPASSSGAPTC